MNNLPLYFDYAASTPLDPAVFEIMKNTLAIEQRLFANPAATSHALGRLVNQEIENARNDLAELIGADTHDLIFTSGATESNNLAIKGYALANEKKGKHLITMSTEHKSVLESMEFLESQGFSVTYLSPKPNGLLDENDLISAIQENTILISIMQVNNETGVIQPVERFSEICYERKIAFHVDAAQSVGKIPIDLKKSHINFMSIACHKMYGPKGIGALYIREANKKNRLQTMMHGGGHEKGFRSGTLATHQILGFGRAATIAKKQMAADMVHIKMLRQIFLKGLSEIPEIILNGDQRHVLPGIINFTIKNLDGVAFLQALPEIAMSMGAACHASSIQPSHVLSAMGISDELAASTFRFSFGRFTTVEEIDFAIEKIKEAVIWLRKVNVSS